MTATRGQCPVCHYSYALRRDGTVLTHSLYFGRDRKLCEGSGKAPGSLTGAERDKVWREMIRPLA